MITNVKVLSRDMIENLLKPDAKVEVKWYLISIYGQGKLFLTPPNIENLKTKGLINCLSLEFDDLTDKQYNNMSENYPIEFKRHNFKLFNEDQAREVIKFLDQSVAEDAILVVHCDAGVSRSGAVGLFATIYLNLNEKDFWKNNSVWPNEYVLRVLKSVSGIGINAQNSTFQEYYLQNSKHALI